MPRLLLYILTLGLSHTAFSQILPFKTYTVKDGLLNKQINTMTRDNRGILWIGTAFGVNWYDGQRFSEPQIATRSGQLYVTNFYKDQKEIIWILTFYNGLYKFENNKFTNFLIDSNRIEATNNNILDMVQYDDKTYLIASDHNVYWFDGKRFWTVDSANKEMNIQFSTVTADRDALFFGSSKGIYEYRKINGKWTFAGKVLQHLAASKIQKLNDDYWVPTNKGIYIFDDLNSLRSGKEKKILLPNEAIGSITPNKITGDVWISASRVYKINGNSYQTYTQQNGLPTNPGTIFCDNENVVWFGSVLGLTKLAAENYTFHDFNSKNVNSMITALQYDQYSNLWCGTFDGIVLKHGNDYKNFYRLHNKQIGYVAWLHHDSGDVYAGTSLGILKMNQNEMRLISTIKTSKMTVTQNGDLLIGTEAGELYKLRDDEMLKYSVSPVLIDFIDGIIQDANNNIWVGYRGVGIRKYREDGMHLQAKGEYSTKTGHRDLRIRCVTLDKKGNMWWGTRTNGVFIVAADEKKTWHITTANGLSANWVRSIGIDKNDIVYLATNKGVNMISGSYDSPVISRLQAVNENFTDETTIIYPSQQALLVGTEQGVLEYFPSKGVGDTLPPRIYFTQLAINGTIDSTTPPYSNVISHRKFSPSSNIIALEFAGINMKDEHKLQYSYMLEGQDREWTQPNERNFITYNLPPGQYRFLVKARNSSGVWSTEPAMFDFMIAKPIWSRWWFITGIFLLAGTGLFLLYRYRVQQAFKLERLRSRISTDLHDDIGSTLSSISILSEMAMRSNAKESEDMMMEIKNNSVMLMERMDDIVWSINPKNDSLDNLLLRIKSFAARLFEARNIDYTINIDESVKEAKLSMESRQHIYMMLKEAINNIVKYSGCTRAEINVNYQHSQLKISVRDNGKGFDRTSIHTGNGLLNIQTRAQQMKADISIESYPGQGTHIAWTSKIR